MPKEINFLVPSGNGKYTITDDLFEALPGLKFDTQEEAIKHLEAVGFRKVEGWETRWEK